jgi:uncharacterized membrane protein
LRYGNAALLAASLAIGALLALIGQTYQTGADTYELFTVWAVLILPWVLLARLPALWVLWLVIVHVAFLFYMDTARWWWFFLDWTSTGAVIALFDCLALAVWEWLASTKCVWMQGRWVPRLIALTAGAAATIMAVVVIVDDHSGGSIGHGWYFMLYVGVLVGLLAVYRYKKPDIFMLAGGALSVIVVLVTAVARVLLESRHGNMTMALFILGVLSMLATAGAAWWLRQVAREMKNEATLNNSEEAAP